MNENDSLLSLEEILEAVNGVHVLGNAPLCRKSVQTDSRLVEENTLFVPLIGEKQDGHSYIPQAIEKGASAVFIRMKNFEDNGNYLEALQKAAAR